MGIYRRAAARPVHLHRTAAETEIFTTVERWVGVGKPGKYTGDDGGGLLFPDGE